MALHLENLLACVYLCQPKAVSRGIVNKVCSIFCLLYCLMGEESDCLGHLGVLNKSLAPQLCNVKALGMNTLLSCPEDIVIIRA